MSDAADDAVGRFSSMLGRLRVSVTHACQLHCKFCHQEGIQSHWRPIHMSVGTFDRLVDAFVEIGGYEIDVTGGDPLVHPEIAGILRVLGGRRLRRALCTNGLLLDRVVPELEAGCVDEVKISVHASDDSVGKALLGRAWSSARLDGMLLLLQQIGVPTTMNFSVTSENFGEFDAVLEKSFEMGTNLLVIDLIGTRWDLQQEELCDTSSDPIIEKLSSLSTLSSVTRDRTGCRISVFKGPGGQRWMVKDVRNGLLFTGMCNGCALKKRCGEGVFVLRVDAEGAFRPCLIRPDLEVVHPIEHMGSTSLRSALEERIGVMMAEPCAFEAGQSIYT
ncbi:radical SAM protein [Micromonospora endolithica]|nr:radical SAM protein [Micromonospora endolithica]TWJ25511.1 molybdenum cofactor biosynthesis enzyme MoaA [Micromonospora endolithica]